MKRTKVSGQFLPVRIFILTAILLTLCFAVVPARGQSTLTFSEWAVPTSSSCPFGLVPVSQDVIYFTDAPCSGAAQIGKLDMRTNTVTVWAGSKLASPQGIVALGGSGGPILFADQGNNTISMLNPVTNQLTTWTLPTGGSAPLRVVSVGIEVFFTEQAGRIGMLNLFNNHVTEWTVPGGPQTPLGIASGSDRNQIWFSQSSGAQLGVLDLDDNTFQQWTIPSGLLSSPFIQGIAVAGRQQVFFADSSPDSAVGQLDPATNVLTVWTTPVSTSPTQLLAKELGESSSGTTGQFLVEFTGPGQNSMWKLLTALQAGTIATVPATPTVVTPTVTTVTPMTTILTQTTTVVTPTITSVTGVSTGGFEQWTVPTATPTTMPLPSSRGAAWLSPRPTETKSPSCDRSGGQNPGEHKSKDWKGSFGKSSKRFGEAGPEREISIGWVLEHEQRTAR